MSLTRYLLGMVLSTPLLLAGCGDLPEFKDAGQLSAAARDREAEEMIAKRQAPEARAWLADGNHGLWKVDVATAKRLVEGLYGAGAPQVYVTNIARRDSKEIASEFMAEVPADAAARARVFQFGEAFWKSYLPDESPEDLRELAEEDKGQKYMMFNFDM